MNTRLIVVAPTQAEARLVASTLYPTLSGAPPHIRAGATLLSWAQYEGITTCPACSSKVGAEHIRKCASHYASIADDRPVDSSTGPYSTDWYTLQTRMRDYENSSERRVILLAHPEALPHSPPSPWLAVGRLDLSEQHLPPDPEPEPDPEPDPERMTFEVLRDLGFSDEQILKMRHITAVQIAEEHLHSSTVTLTPDGDFRYRRGGSVIKLHGPR
jgi:hypothetical protein